MPRWEPAVELLIPLVLQLLLSRVVLDGHRSHSRRSRLLHWLHEQPVTAFHELCHLLGALFAGFQIKRVQLLWGGAQRPHVLAASRFRGQMALLGWVWAGAPLWGAGLVMGLAAWAFAPGLVGAVRAWASAHMGAFHLAGYGQLPWAILDFSSIFLRLDALGLLALGLWVLPGAALSGEDLKLCLPGCLLAALLAALFGAPGMVLGALWALLLTTVVLGGVPALLLRLLAR